MSSPDLHAGLRASLSEHIAQRLFAGQPFDALVSLDPAHCGYLSGYHSMSSDMSRHYKMAVVRSREDFRLIVGVSDLLAALEMVGSPERIIPYGSFFYSRAGIPMPENSHPPVPLFTDALRVALDQIVPQGGTLAVDATGTEHLDHDFEQLSPTARTVITTARIEYCRRLKFPFEVQLIGRAANALESGLRSAEAIADVGASEHDVAAAIAQAIVREGGVPRSLAVTSGRRSELVDAYPSSRRLDRGDLLRIDLSATWDGYWADMARTLIVGEPDDDQQDAYRAITAGLDAERAQLRPGVLASKVFETAAQAVRSNGLAHFERHHCGHGIGITINEYPQLAATSDVPLEAGMVLCIETPYYRRGWGGMMREDIVHITPDGVESLTSVDVGLSVAADTGIKAEAQ